MGASRVLYCLATCVHDHMLSHIRDAKTPKEAWENLKKIFSADTSARKLQLWQELNNIKQKEMSMSDYTSKIKSLRLAWIHQRQHRRRRDGASMLGRPSAMIQSVKNGNLGERYPSLVLQPPINAIG